MKREQEQSGRTEQPTQQQSSFLFPPVDTKAIGFDANSNLNILIPPGVMNNMDNGPQSATTYSANANSNAMLINSKNLTLPGFISMDQIELTRPLSAPLNSTPDPFQAMFHDTASSPSATTQLSHPTSLIGSTPSAYGAAPFSTVIASQHPHPLTPAQRAALDDVHQSHQQQFNYLTPDHQFHQQQQHQQPLMIQPHTLSTGPQPSLEDQQVLLERGLELSGLTPEQISHVAAQIRNNRYATIPNSEIRRQLHIQSEQKRRAQIKCGFDELKYEIPSCAGTKRMSKAAILVKAIEYIRELKREREFMVFQVSMPPQAATSPTDAVDSSPISKK